jgi:hypothetical protein
MAAVLAVLVATVLVSASAPRHNVAASSTHETKGSSASATCHLQIEVFATHRKSESTFEE